MFCDPVKFIEPVNSWVSVNVSPNLVEPLEKTMEDEINSVWNSWAVNIPLTVKSPPNTCSPPVALALILPPITTSFVTVKSPVKVSVVFSKNEPEIADEFIEPEITSFTFCK